MATAMSESSNFVHALGRGTIAFVSAIGDVSLFAGRMTGWMVRRFPKRSVLLPAFYQVGVLSVPVVIVTGAFIGMVLAVQTSTLR